MAHTTRTASRMARFLSEPVRTKPGTRRSLKRASAKAERRAAAALAGYAALDPLPADEHEHPLDLLDPGWGLFVTTQDGALIFLS